MSPSAFYQLLEGKQVYPTTSAPPPRAFQDVFRAARTTARDLICITVASNLSSAHESASTAAEMARSEEQGEVRVVDSKAAAGALGLIALEAAICADRGADLPEVVDAVLRLIPQVNLLAFLDTLEYLKRGGRVPKVAAWAGSVLGIKPLAELTLGEARVLDKPRSRVRAIRKLLNLAEARVGDRPVHMNVMHANSPADAEYLCEQLQLKLNCCDLFVSEFTPVMGAHLGPGVLGLAFYSEYGKLGDSSRD